MMKDTWLEGAAPSSARSPVGVAERPAAADLARELIARLVPDADAYRLTAALLAEREARAGGPADRSIDSSAEIAARELARVRSQLALGAAARTLQHAFSDPLTALLAETQLLALEPLLEEHRLAVGRILELARRLVILSRGMGALEERGPIG